MKNTMLNIRHIILAVLLLLLIFSSNLIADNNDIKIFFSPQDECGREILVRLNSAEKSIELAMYQMTSRVLSEALASAARRGVVVRVFLDGENAEEYYSKADFLKKNKVLVKNEKGDGLMHNKFCVIDDKVIVTGSYNWTVSADLKNDENVVIIESGRIVDIYKRQFEDYWRGTYPDNAFYADKNNLRKTDGCYGNSTR